MAYSTTELARQAMASLNPIINGLRVNDLNSYVDENSRVRQDFIRDENYIRDALNRATNAAYDVNRAQALQDAMTAEDTNYTNTKNAIAEMRRNLVGSGSSGANVGAANATALQALLGLGQQNTQTTTEGLRAVNNVSRERASALAQNAVDAINTANDATAKMYDAATSSYGSDRSYAAQGAAQALGELAAAADTAASQENIAADTNAVNERMNNVTAKATVDAAREGAHTTSNNVNTNYNTSTETKKVPKTATKAAKSAIKNSKKTGTKTSSTKKTSTKKTSTKKSTTKKRA